MLTNSEFHEAWKNLSFPHVPDGFWDQEIERQKKHRFVGRKIHFRGKLIECIRATDNQMIFKLDDHGGELIVNGDDLENIKNYKE